MSSKNVVGQHGQFYLSIDTVPTPAAFYKRFKDAKYGFWPIPVNQIHNVNIKDIMFRLL